MPKPLAVLGIFIVAGCTQTTQNDGPSLARGMCEAGYSFVAFQRALSDPDNGFVLGERPCSSQIAFHVVASRTSTTGAGLNIAAPLSGVTIGGNINRTDGASNSSDNLMTMQVENPVCSIKDYLTAATKKDKDKGFSVEDIEKLYGHFDERYAAWVLKHQQAQTQPLKLSALLEKCKEYDSKPAN